ncbi:MAG: hypothetical protein QOD99_1533 [Chthoniobacter sp.]|nr:hypothetical protein [Chthoniobacter sp.]
MSVANAALPLEIAVYLTFFAGAPASGTLVANYTFSGNTLTSSDSDANSTAADLVVGVGLSGSATFFNSTFNSPAYGVPSNSTPSTETLAIAGNDYFSFTITPASGSLAYGALSFDFVIQNNSNTITENVSARWSVDNFASSLGTNSFVGNSGFTSAGGHTTFTLSSFPAQSGPVVFRLYFFDDQDSQFSTVGIDSISLTATAVPEPLSLTLALVGMGFIAHRAGMRAARAQSHTTH